MVEKPIYPRRKFLKVTTLAGGDLLLGGAVVGEIWEFLKKIFETLEGASIEIDSPLKIDWGKILKIYGKIAKEYNEDIDGFGLLPYHFSEESISQLKKKKNEETVEEAFEELNTIANEVLPWLYNMTVLPTPKDLAEAMDKKDWYEYTGEGKKLVKSDLEQKLDRNKKNGNAYSFDRLKAYPDREDLLTNMSNTDRIYYLWAFIHFILPVEQQEGLVNDHSVTWNELLNLQHIFESGNPLAELPISAYKTIIKELEDQRNVAQSNALYNFNEKIESTEDALKADGLKPFEIQELNGFLSENKAYKMQESGGKSLWDGNFSEVYQNTYTVEHSNGMPEKEIDALLLNFLKGYLTEIKWVQKYFELAFPSEESLKKVKNVSAYKSFMKKVFDSLKGLDGIDTLLKKLQKQVPGKFEFEEL